MQTFYDSCDADCVIFAAQVLLMSHGQNNETNTKAGHLKTHLPINSDQVTLS